MEIAKDEVRHLIESLTEIQTSLKTAHPRNGNSHSTVTLTGGGVGVWAATTCCLVMLGMMSVAAIWLATVVITSNQRAIQIESRIDANDDYLNAIFQQVPEIKKRVDAERAAKKESN